METRGRLPEAEEGDKDEASADSMAAFNVAILGSAVVAAALGTRQPLPCMICPAASHESHSGEAGGGGDDQSPHVPILGHAESTSRLPVRTQQPAPATTSADEDTTWLLYLLASCMVLGVFALGVAVYALTRPERSPPRLWRPVAVTTPKPTPEVVRIPHVPTFEPPPDEFAPVTVTEEGTRCVVTKRS
ncbi:hypothetical protein HPB50_014715 [Hyalomma asiaticum]|uniref:Uncharacterized protein n=1 Tax=Hyalomma asiaticum TaxID=266040 RepID=A0ACB7RMW0_HYAAI|nr:hypothetical protein HPB50_014715 [Hyalomma asiaticum]